MKVKIQILAMMFIAALAFSACSDDDKDDHITVPVAISDALKAQYPSATHIEWEQKGKYYVADCRLDGKEASVWYNTNAEWQLTDLDVAWVDLPGTVQTAFMESEYASWEQEDFDVLETPLQPIEYVIEVEKGNKEVQLFYSEEGNLLLAKDVTGKDDTHWPK
ncbi:PepSY-like domain-containing protein [Bacteroides sp.]|uniref:PepSY-like domain-containing protein n=1 Tax=Bacteroides sp. TaxID=29523 RepID=UPI00260D5AC4|nr:PepSY-like domain-containing protein [Bacteroides sp.]